MTTYTDAVLIANEFIRQKFIEALTNALINYNDSLNISIDEKIQA
jgi:hypothetical protein